jgi:hypothetical protein
MTEMNRRRDDQLQHMLGRMEAKLDRVVKDSEDFRENISPRVRSLETWRSGIAATVTALLAAVAYLFRGGH